MPAEMQAVWQRNYAEMLWQLALFPSGRDAMQQEAAVLKALEEVRERGMTAEAREHAAGALMALSDREMHASASDEPKHIMLSYQVRLLLACDHPSVPAECSSSALCFAQWDSQAMILRIHGSLLRRGYLVWIDTEMMKGSTMDAMSEAIEGAEVVCYGVSLA